MLFGEEKDWKEFLCDKAGVELAELIERSKKHRCAYMQADDVKVAQLWCALTEVYVQLKHVEERLGKIENAVKGVVGLGEIAKKEALEERVSGILKAKTSEEREQVKRIVDSLMNF